MSDQGLRQQGRLEGLRDSGAADAGSSGLNPLQRGVRTVGGQRNASLLAAVGVVGILGLLNFRKKKAAAAAAGTTTTTDPTAATGFDSGPYDLWNAWETQYEALQGQVNDLRGQIPVPAGSPSSPPIPVPVPTSVPPHPAPIPAPIAPGVWAPTYPTYTSPPSNSVRRTPAPVPPGVFAPSNWQLQ